MIIGRSIVGLAVGSASFVVPLYISELSPSRWRGRLVTVTMLFITGGQVVAYIIGWLFSQSDNGWRWMVGLGVVPAAVQLAMLLGMPETPRYLVKAGRAEQAERVLRKMYGAQEGKNRFIGGIMRAIQKEIHEEDTAISGKPGGTMSRLTIIDLFSNGGNRRALAIACILQGAQQLCGFNSLMYIVLLLLMCNTCLLRGKVLFGDYILTRWIHLTDFGVSHHCSHQFPLHSRGLFRH